MCHALGAFAAFYLGKSPEDDLLLQVQGIVAEYESARIYPDLPAQKVSILPLREGPQNVLRNVAEVLLPKENEVIVRPVDPTSPHYSRM
jgi:hypothetical protein